MKRLALALALAGCAGPARPASPPVTQAAWDDANDRLDALRGRFPSRPYVERLRVSFHEPRTHKVFEARGAVAVQPGRAARMVLVGPAGATALDMWITRERWRFHIPALGPPRRGDSASYPGELPVGFFRWWFLAPLDGRLLTVSTDGGLVLRDDGATVTLDARAVGRHAVEVHATRRAGPRTERLEFVGLVVHPAGGDLARYMDDGTGLVVDVTVEGVSFGIDDPSAFLDPDGAGVSL